jgi:hypothetical protein
MSRAAVNRTILAVAGLILLAAGLLVLAGGFDLYHRWQLSPPSWWPLTSPDQPVLSEASRTRWVNRSWWWPVAIAVPAVVLAGSLWWLFAQLRRSGPAGLHLPTARDVHLAVRVHSRAVEGAIRAETAAFPGVARVTVHLVGDQHRPQIRALIRLTPAGSPAEVLDRFHTGPLDHARTSLGLAALPAELHLQVTTAPERPLPKAPRVL